MSGKPEQCWKQGERCGQNSEHGCRSADRETLDELEAHHPHAEHADHHGDASEEDGAACRIHGLDGCFFERQATLQPVSIPRDDEQRVVDTDSETDHHSDKRGEVWNRQELRCDDQQASSGENAEECDAYGKAHGEHRSEGQDQDDDCERETNQLCLGRFKFGKHLAAEQNFTAINCGLNRLQLLRVSQEFLLAERLVDIDVGKCQFSCKWTLARHLLCALGRIGRSDGEAFELRCFGKELFHARLDAWVVDSLFRFEEQLTAECAPTTGIGKVVADHVEPPLGLA